MRYRSTMPTFITRHLVVVVTASCVVVLAVLVALGSRHDTFSARLLSPSTVVTSYRELQWDEVVPKNWNPVQHFLERNRAKVDDGTLEGEQLRDVMRATWDNAPTVSELDGTSVRLPGYVVPLDEDDDGLKEFLLVPYFGACIHTPPPSANQIVLVTTRVVVKGFRAMDTVWVSGRLSTGRQSSPLGISGYRLNATAVERYAPARQ